MYGKRKDEEKDVIKKQKDNRKKGRENKRLGKDKRNRNETKDVEKYECGDSDLELSLRTREWHSGFKHMASD